MHIPDGLIPNGMNIPLLGAAVAAFSVAAKKVYAKLTEKAFVRKLQLATFPPTGTTQSGETTRLSSPGRQKLQRMGVVATLLLAIQAVDLFFVLGEPAHLFGCVLAAIVLGPAAGFVTVTLVLTIQAMLLGDGGMRGPDFSAQALNLTARWMNEHYLAREEGLAVREHDVYRADLETAEEAFLTGARMEVVPLRKLGGHALPEVGDVSRRMLSRLRSLA